MKNLMIKVAVSDEVEMIFTITAIQQPFIPAPLEPVIEREPTMTEFCDAMAKITKGDFKIKKGGQDE